MMRSIPKVSWLRTRKALYISSALASTSMMAIGAFMGIGNEPAPPTDDKTTTSGQEAVKLPAVKRLRTEIAEVLSGGDILTYQLAYDAQSQSDWKKADVLLADVDDKVLVGHVLANRYKNKNYQSTYAELHDWLAKYSDYPQANEIYKLAIAKRGAKDARLQEIGKRPQLSGYGDDNGLASRSKRLGLISDAAWNNRAESKHLWNSIENMIDKNQLEAAEQALASERARTLLETMEFDVARWHLAANYLYRGNPTKAYTLASRSASRNGMSIPGAHWISGISAWQLNDHAAASRHFTAMAESPTGQSPWEVSTAAFWAYRANKATGQNASARRYLELAASYPRTFYGILARKVQGRPLDINRSEIPELSNREVRELYKTEGVRRTVALAQLGKTEAAEAELRALFPQADRETREQLLSVAHSLNLPAVQISMAKALKRQGASYDVALYPEPDWKPFSGFALDPSLVFAFARQESGFRASAKSYGGAMGVMQIMPDTAKYMTAQADLPALTKDSLFEPEANMTLGQSYLSHLLENRTVSGNLIYLSAAYNAGPGKLMEWNTSIQHKGDPLLFLENIPFGETRNYVTQVLTSYWIYQEMDGRRSNSATTLAKGEWPQYDAATWRVADSVSLTDGAV